MNARFPSAAVSLLLPGFLSVSVQINELMVDDPAPPNHPHGRLDVDANPDGTLTRVWRSAAPFSSLRRRFVRLRLGSLTSLDGLARSIPHLPPLFL
jgi:hypothetical protein